MAPLMGSYAEYDGGVTSLMFFPVHWFTACNDYGMLARFTPLSPQETEVELTWLVHPEAREGVDYEVEEVTWLWLKTLQEDLHICANNQAGVNSRYYEPGPYPTTLRRRIVDVAGKIVRHAGQILLKVTAATWKQLQIDRLWQKSAHPPPFAWV